MTMDLSQPDTVIHSTDDEPVFEGDFTSGRLADESLVFEAQFRAGRYWDPEPNDDGGVPLRTKPDPLVKIYDTANGHVMTHSVPAPEGIVFLAILTSRDIDGLHDLLMNAVDGIEEDYEGVTSVDVKFFADDYGHLSNGVVSRVKEILDV